jgi:integrin beta 3
VSSSAVVDAASAAGLAVPEEVDGERADDGAGPVGLLARIRAERRLRVITLVSLSVVVLGLLPLIFGIRSVARDPIFTSLDALNVPGWATAQVEDQGSGSRWCFLDCRFRERTAQSSKPYAETAKVYSAALTEAGWQRWQVSQCPEQPVTDGSYTCWKRDEFTLDLWVGPPECAVDQVAAQDPAAMPSTGVVPTTPPGKCVGSTVSIKVQNAITDLRGKAEPQPNPSLVGETPDPTLGPDPLLTPTPAKS